MQKASWRRKAAGLFRWLAPIIEELAKDFVRAEIESKVGREIAKARNRGELSHPGEELAGELPRWHEEAR